MPRPFHPEGAGQRAVTPSEGAGGGTVRELEMESVLALGGLVLLRGEGQRHGGGRAMCATLGVASRGSRGRRPPRSHAVSPSLTLPRLRRVGGAQSLEGAYQEICTVVSTPQLLPEVPGAEVGGEARARLCDTLHLCLSGEQVHILGCEVSEDEFREGFESSINSR